MIPTTLQGAYDLLVKSAYDGTFPSIREEIDETDKKIVFRCLYRGPNGKKCGAGIFIPDEKYQVSWEGRSTDYPLIRESIFPPFGMTVDDIDFIQGLHDEVALEGRYVKKEWDPKLFVTFLNKMKCFQGVVKHQP